MSFAPRATWSPHDASAYSWENTVVQSGRPQLHQTSEPVDDAVIRSIHFTLSIVEHITCRLMNCIYWLPEINIHRRHFPPVSTLAGNLTTLSLSRVLNKHYEWKERAVMVIQWPNAAYCSHVIDFFSLMQQLCLDLDSRWVTAIHQSDASINLCWKTSFACAMDLNR